MTAAEADQPVMPGRGTRRFVLGFLAVVLACAFVGIEAWPFTGWNLYSRRLTDVVTRYRAVTVDTEGAEHGIPWGRLPVAYASTYRQLPSLDRREPDEREPVCEAWADATRAIGGEVEAVRVYWTESRRDFDGRRTTLRSDLRFTCAEVVDRR
ncbi:MAG: hypothetical protein M3R01_11825 [Actinomycetota bacterium]|nr:hypothetical protein [Actinomycetota bacterium]